MTVITVVCVHAVVGFNVENLFFIGSTGKGRLTRAAGTLVFIFVYFVFQNKTVLAIANCFLMILM